MKVSARQPTTSPGEAQPQNMLRRELVGGLGKPLSDIVMLVAVLLFGAKVIQDRFPRMLPLSQRAERESWIKVAAPRQHPPFRNTRNAAGRWKELARCFTGMS